MKALTEIRVPFGTHTIAIEQARAFAGIARNAAAAIAATNTHSHEHLLAFLVNAGLAAELHFKALMIVARNGRVTKGHDLKALYGEFPEFLTRFLEWQYLQLRPATGWPMTLTALTFRDKPPPPPGPALVPNYSTFADAVASSSRIFEDCRYFFERVHDGDWTIFAYAPSAIDAILVSLENAYAHFVAGDFAPAPDTLSGHAA